MDSHFGRLMAAVDELGPAALRLWCSRRPWRRDAEQCSLYDPASAWYDLPHADAGLARSIRHDALLSNVDMLPTLLELLDIAAPEGVQAGRSWG